MGIPLMDYDVIIIGAGPAGSVTATAVAKAGYRVLVLEKNQKCMSPCAGYISNTINLELPDPSVIQSKITKMRTYSPDLSFHDFDLNGFVVDRPSFDRSLVVRAAGEGADIKWGSPLTVLSCGVVKFSKGEAKGRIIVGADGVFSKTAALLGLHRQKVAVCAQYHLKGTKPIPNTAEIFFNADYAPGGYAWVYPTGEDSAKVGVGTTSGNPRKYLDAFVKASIRFGGKNTEYITGALPISALREKLCFGNILLVGDSAGMCDPVTGAGINNAMIAGEIAGRTIISALENEDLTLLDQYEAKIRRLMGKPLSRALGKRKKLSDCNNEMLQKHLPELWVTFRQYWENL
ncbi:MAG: NAD(P)/FAD-dependent oxidoreductase [Candidatus Methanoperedens sp.]|nr:NAD(P)/FAD-dependent oxidoreductase [Candidatus Methanoperedens sp.]MCZ7371308.1 NAD(P)/FAD-dependent oxidoreductase [Candidatus Methanoperedens sp.]